LGRALAVVTRERGARLAGRLLLAGVGLAIVAYLVRESGPERVAHVLWEAGRWVPLVFLLELVQWSSDYVALRVILGDRGRDIPTGTWVRAMSVAYAMMSLLPAGRVAGEVARGTLFSRYIGAPRAATTGTQLQASYLFANAVLSLAAWIMVATRFGLYDYLALLLAGNVLFQSLVSGGLLAVLRDARVGRWLDRLRRRFFRRTAESPPLDPAERKKIPFGAMLACTAGRSAQVVQYAVILAAVGGVVTVPNAFITHGIHLVGASLGDLLPNQLGVTDGMYRTFANQLGLSSEPARALSIAFVVRIAQLSLSAVCVVAAAATRQGERRDGGAPASAGAGARS
jgi:hypothetical protein